MALDIDDQVHRCPSGFEKILENVNFSSDMEIDDSLDDEQDGYGDLVRFCHWRDCEKKPQGENGLGMN